MIIKLIITIQLATHAVNMVSPAIPSMDECINVTNEMVALARSDIEELYSVVDISGQCIEVAEPVNTNSHTTTAALKR